VQGHGTTMLPLLCAEGGLDINSEKKNGLRPIQVAEQMYDHRLVRQMKGLGATSSNSACGSSSGGSGAGGGDSSECVICMDKQAKGAFIPCGEDGSSAL
jgi:hypothetical protein